MNHRSLLLIFFICSAFACSRYAPNSVDGSSFQPAQSPLPQASTTASSAEEEEIMAMESQEEYSEDRDGLSFLIGQLETDSSVSSETDQAAAKPPADAERQADATMEPPLSDADATALFSSVFVPPASEIWKLSKKQCEGLLSKAGIKTAQVEIETPFVEMPLLLEGPVEGVRIAPKWVAKGPPVQRVMDCRLIVALIPLARKAAAKGITSVYFFSTWRPLTRPGETCDFGRPGKSCRHRQEAWKKAENGKMSQHHRATAIDIHSFGTRDGRVIEVLKHYERNDNHPPCTDPAKTPDGIFLQSLACELHTEKAFHVMLTPNANKAHHNHFHFDITPNATWYIIR